MVPTDEQMGDWLEEISQKFPDAFFEELDGGIQLEEQALPDPEFPPGEMYIMGEYCHDMLGRYIVLYYGSFAALLADEDEETWKDEIFATVAHEFTHHMEDTAGLHALDDKDAEFLRQAREELGRKRPEADLSRAYLWRWEEGLCAQLLHRGPYDDEPESVARLAVFVREQGYREDFSPGRYHHEIYLGDPRRTAPDRLRTVIRHPVREACVSNS